jgi:hypothetical protein
MEGIENTVHEETQDTEEGFDLTVAEVYVTEEAGSVDFGGGELEGATVSPVETKKRNEDDDYGWWNLTAGTYLIEHNESLNVDEPVTVRTRTAVLDRGGSHPTVRLKELPRLPFTVGDGLCVKENARVSTVLGI